MFEAIGKKGKDLYIACQKNFEENLPPAKLYKLIEKVLEEALQEDGCWGASIYLISDSDSIPSRSVYHWKT